MSAALRIYRKLAHSFPHEFKLAYGTEVEQLAEEMVDEIAARQGFFGLIRLLGDIAVRVPIEYLSEMHRDMRYALRSLAKSPGFALVAVVSMGLGIGLTTMVYTSKWQVVTRKLPAAANASNLVMAEKPFSYYYIEQFREEKALFTGVAAVKTGVPFNITFQGSESAKPQRVFGQLVSADYFSVLGVQPQLGRMLSPQLDKPGDAPVVVITDRFWRNRLNSSPDAIGQVLRLNGQSATIVGITPRDFNGVLAINPSELFVPVTSPAALAPELANDVLHQRNAKEFLALICLADGISVERAGAALDSITHRLDEQNTSSPIPTGKARRATLFSVGTRVPIPRDLKPVVLGFLMALMGLIMAIACVNLANMLLARGVNRRKELAIRLAVGASRFRLVRQLMSEGILLSLLGGIAGFGFAYFLLKLDSRFMPPTAVPVELDIAPDWHVAVFVFALAVVCGIGFSLIPALRATRADVSPVLKDGPAGQLPGYRLLGLRNLLMVAQVTGSLMLLLVTGFLVLGLSKESRVETKVDAHSMYLLSIDPVRDGYTSEKAKMLFEQLPEKLMSAGAVRGVTLAAQAPFSLEDDEDTEVQLTAEDSRGARVERGAIEEAVGAGYFAALNEPVVAGREFGERDQRIQPDSSSVWPVMLNESAAHAFFGNANAIGGRIRDDQHSYAVVGVVPDLNHGLGNTHLVAYLPLTEHNFARPPANGITVLVRSDPGTDAPARIRREMASINPRLNIFNMRTLSEELARSRAYQRFHLNTYTGMGLFGLVLASIGLAGITAYAVAQRRKEIGIRMALGARKAQILRLVLREGVALVSAGTALGFLGAYALAKLLSALTSVFVESMRIGTSDPRLLIGAPLLLAALALLACYLPARRAMKIDPLKALREG